MATVSTMAARAMSSHISRCRRSSRSMTTPVNGSIRMAGTETRSTRMPSDSSEPVFWKMYQVVPAWLSPLPIMEIMLARNTKRSGRDLRMSRICADYLHSKAKNGRRPSLGGRLLSIASAGKSCLQSQRVEARMGHSYEGQASSCLALRGRFGRACSHRVRATGPCPGLHRSRFGRAAVAVAALRHAGRDVLFPPYPELVHVAE